MSSPDKQDTRKPRLLATCRNFTELAACLGVRPPDDQENHIEISAMEFDALLRTLHFFEHCQDSVETQAVQSEYAVEAGNSQLQPKKLLDIQSARRCTLSD